MHLFIKLKNKLYVISLIINIKKHITRYALSRKTNIRYDTICNYCSGNVTLINAEYLKIFCSVLECNIGDIMEYIE